MRSLTKEQKAVRVVADREYHKNLALEKKLSMFDKLDLADEELCKIDDNDKDLLEFEKQLKQIHNRRFNSEGLK